MFQLAAPWRRQRLKLMARNNRRINLDRASYLDREDYLRDLLRSGPDFGDLDSLGPPGPGFYSQLLTTVWGCNGKEYAEAVTYEQIVEQQQRPHIFVRKWPKQTRFFPCRPRRRRGG
jgi:hypothetical protein